ncbi:MAG: hypothetical protein GX443_12985 [Deltaproteobacteria bacterium]|nr:hypothetical protein [Deltaproteobacteria bacterium]
MDFEAFLRRCREENTVSDFESYLSYCIFEKGGSKGETLSVEEYSAMRDRAFDGRSEEAARRLYEISGAIQWQEGEWEGAMK